MLPRFGIVDGYWTLLSRGVAKRKGLTGYQGILNLIYSRERNKPEAAHARAVV